MLNFKAVRQRFGRLTIFWRSKMMSLLEISRARKSEEGWLELHCTVVKRSHRKGESVPSGLASSFSSPEKIETVSFSI